ncbi:MAG: NAD-dependent succinate-semialdehyde dehydrogenase [Acidobacteria bacterium]|nr:NAD-dependent succinate-semialdehyde dehydrogenase [Acidobacteriota bacterium]
MTIESVNPATGAVVQTYEELGEEALERALGRSAAAFPAWRATELQERTARLRAAAEVLEARKEELARLMAVEMGKPVREGRGEIEKCAWACRHYAAEAPGLLAPREIETDASRSFVVFEPLGCVLAVMPWNFPFWQVFRFIAPHLTAGNIGLLKHASNVAGCALAIEEILRAADYPEGVFQTLLIGSRRVDALIADSRVHAVTLTGSTPAGRAVARRAGECLKKTVLELGGSDPYVVLDDADLELAASQCVTARLVNGGQSCIAAKRFVVTPGPRAAFVRRVVEQMAARRMGDPLDETTQVGPMARRDLRDELHEQVAASVAAGARCLLGGEIPEGPGAFYPPTVLADVRPGMPAYHEELFGPVAAILPAESEEAALRIANDTSFGLGAAVFTRDAEKGARIAARRLDAGNCFVNAFVRSDPRLPFGGVKESGYGRELGSFGLYEFVNVKSVYVA